MIFSKNNFVQYYGGNDVTVSENENNTIKLYKPSHTGHYGVACTTELDPAGAD